MSQPFGQRGEQLATHYLKQQGYTIIGTNWHCRFGEIDIIARQGDTLVFVEVRARHAALPEAAFASISKRKRARLLRAAHLYLADHQLENANWRVDVIAIAIPPSGRPMIEHVADALDW
ncbi:MAG: YraN family protein [Chloroflexi bacterium]|nr:YraN family protein [Chloroflexota bacterium]